MTEIATLSAEGAPPFWFCLDLCVHLHAQHATFKPDRGTSSFCWPKQQTAQVHQRVHSAKQHPQPHHALRASSDGNKNLSGLEHKSSFSWEKSVSTINVWSRWREQQAYRINFIFCFREAIFYGSCSPVTSLPQVNYSNQFESCWHIHHRRADLPERAHWPVRPSPGREHWTEGRWQEEQVPPDFLSLVNMYLPWKGTCWASLPVEGSRRKISSMDWLGVHLFGQQEDWPTTLFLSPLLQLLFRGFLWQVFIYLFPALQSRWSLEGIRLRVTAPRECAQGSGGQECV